MAAPPAFATCTANAATADARPAPAGGNASVAKFCAYSSGLMTPTRAPFPPLRRLAARNRNASSGCSLRKFEPMSSAARTRLKPAMRNSEAGNAGAAASSLKSHCCRRWSMWLPPSARANFCRRKYSSMVEV